MRFVKICLVISAALLFCSFVHYQDIEVITSKFKQGINHVSLEHENSAREFIVYLPKNFKLEKVYPVFFAFHGGGGTKEQMAQEWLTGLLDKYEWIGVMPQGLLKSWNSEDQEGFVNRMSTADDIGFVKKIAAYLREHLNINDKKQYAYGISNGSVMAYTLARKTDIFSAIIAQSGTMLQVQNLIPGTKRLSVFHLHGKQDIHVPYDGGESETLLIPFKGVQETVEIWAKHNGSQNEPVLEKRDGGLSVFRYPDCLDGTKVVLYSFSDGPHNLRPKVAELKLLDEIFSQITTKSN